MKQSLKQYSPRWWEADLFSAKDFVRHAVLVCLIFAVAHFCGLREFTSVLNGTTGSTELDWQTAAALGVTYVLLYLAFVLGVPTMLLAATLLALWHRFVRRPAPKS